jgi:hypothetical protein
MKKGILFLIIAAAVTANAQAQSLKDLLYSGKLKLDSTSVIRKGDDLRSKIDTSTKKAVEPATPKTAPVTDDAGKKATPLDTLTASVNLADSATTSVDVVKAAAVPAKSNTKLWKEYTDSLVSTLKTELLPNKKIKKETYFVIVDYEIGTDGVVSILNVIATPENAFLQQEVKKRMELTTPQLAPVLDSNKQPRKTKKKYNFSITKE